MAIEQGRLLNLSRQQLVDCVDAPAGFPYTNGCYSGSAPDALVYMQSQGVATEAAYGSFTGKKSVCKSNLLSSLPASQLVRLSSPAYEDIRPGSATALMQVGETQQLIGTRHVVQAILLACALSCL